MPTSMAAQAAAQAAASALQEWMDEVKRDAEDTQRATALHTQQLSDELTAVKHENELLKRIVDTLGTKCDDFVTRFIRMEDSLSGISGIQQVVADTRQRTSEVERTVSDQQDTLSTIQARQNEFHTTVHANQSHITRTETITRDTGAAAAGDHTIGSQAAGSSDPITFVSTLIQPAELPAEPASYYQDDPSFDRLSLSTASTLGQPSPVTARTRFSTVPIEEEEDEDEDDEDRDESLGFLSVSAPFQGKNKRPAGAQLSGALKRSRGKENLKDDRGQSASRATSVSSEPDPRSPSRIEFDDTTSNIVVARSVQHTLLVSDLDAADQQTRQLFGTTLRSTSPFTTASSVNGVTGLLQRFAPRVEKSHVILSRPSMASTAPQAVGLTLPKPSQIVDNSQCDGPRRTARKPQKIHRPDCVNTQKLTGSQLSRGLTQEQIEAAKF